MSILRCDPVGMWLSGVGDRHAGDGCDQREWSWCYVDEALFRLGRG